MIVEGVDVIEVFGSFCAGLGLFFVGIKMLTTHLGEVTGRRFRRFGELTMESLSVALKGFAIFNRVIENLVGIFSSFAGQLKFVTDDVANSLALLIADATIGFCEFTQHGKRSSKEHTVLDLAF